MGNLEFNVPNLLGSVSPIIIWSGLSADIWTFVTITWNGSLGADPVCYFNGERKTPVSTDFDFPSETKRDIDGIILLDYSNSSGGQRVTGRAR